VVISPIFSRVDKPPPEHCGLCIGTFGTQESLLAELTYASGHAARRKPKPFPAAFGCPPAPAMPRGPSRPQGGCSIVRRGGTPQRSQQRAAGRGSKQARARCKHFGLVTRQRSRTASSRTVADRAVLSSAHSVLLSGLTAGKLTVSPTSVNFSSDGVSSSLVPHVLNPSRACGCIPPKRTLGTAQPRRTR
jgi:hypothetical protein